MNTQRVTISMPKYLFDKVQNRVGPRQMSKFINLAIEKEIMQNDIEDKVDPIDSFLNLRDEIKTKATRKEILTAIKKGRT